MDIKPVVNLCSRTWSLTALGLMANGASARISPLAAAAGCGRTAMGASVTRLVECDLLERNPGHGHPLRPEYRLTPAGEQIADWAGQLMGLVPHESDQLLLRSKWVLPVLSCLTEEQRYGDLRRALNPVTDRALSGCLGGLSEQDWVFRKVATAVSPPAVSYRAINIGKKVQTHLQSFPLAA